MGEPVVVAYVPVLHEGYVRFLRAHARERRLCVLGPELHADDRAIAKDIRALDAELIARAIDALGICASVTVLDATGARALDAQAPRLVFPAEDVSYRVAERWFPRCEVAFDSVFLRWDKTRSARLMAPQPDRRASVAEAVRELAAPDGELPDAELRALAEREAALSVDWWRQVGAAIRFADGTVDTAVNRHLPDPAAPYVVGDPRASFFKGVHLELSTAVHAEAALIAYAARAGRSTAGATLYVTDFPCPPCAKLIAGAGVSRLLYRDGYAVLDGQDVLAAAGVEIVQVTPRAA